MEDIKYKPKTFKLHLMGKRGTSKVFKQNNGITRTALYEINLVFKGS